MHLAYITLWVILVAVQTAQALHDGSLVDSRDTTCMTESDAQQVASNWLSLYSNFSDSSANEMLREDFQEISESLNTMIDGGCAAPMKLGKPTFSFRQQFEKGQGSQPASTLNILKLWYNCNSATVRWSLTSQNQLVIGLVVLEASVAPAGSKYPWIIQNAYSEFDSGAYLVNLEFCVPDCVIMDGLLGY